MFTIIVSDYSVLFLSRGITLSEELEENQSSDFLFLFVCSQAQSLFILFNFTAASLNAVWQR